MMLVERCFLAVLGFCFGSAVLAHDGTHPNLIAPFAAKRISHHVYVVHSPQGLSMPSPENLAFINNPAFVVAPHGVIVVDPGSSWQIGAELVKTIREISDKPVIAIINTHIHGDHWLGNDGVRRHFPQVAIYAHPRMLARMKNGEGERWLSMFGQATKGGIGGTRVVAPTRGVVDGETLSLGGLLFRFRHFKAHTDTDIMVEVIADQTLFLGDVVTNLAIPSRGQPEDAYYKGQLEATRVASQLPITHYIPGHGPAGDRRFVLESLRFQEALYGAVAKHFKRGLSDFEMKEPIQRELSEFKHWPGFDALGQVISRIYLEIEAAEF